MGVGVVLYGRKPLCLSIHSRCWNERDNERREINELAFKTFPFGSERALRLNGIKIYKLSTDAANEKTVEEGKRGSDGERTFSIIVAVRWGLAMSTGGGFKHGRLPLSGRSFLSTAELLAFNLCLLLM